MSLTFNEFQRELNKRGIEPRTAYMLTLVYERLGEVTKQVDEMAAVTMMLAEQLQGFVHLRELDVKDLDKVKKRIGGIGKEPGVGVHSVANEPE